MGEKSKSRTNVRSLILQFENKSNMNSFSKSLSNLPKQTKSQRRLISFDSYKVPITKPFEIKRPVILKLEELKNIRDDVESLQQKLNDVPENLIKNVEYQNEIMFCLVELAMLESNGNQKIKNEKEKLIRILQNCQFGITKFFMKQHLKNVTPNLNVVRNYKSEMKIERSSPDYEHESIENKVKTLKNLFEEKSKNSATKIVPNFRVEKKINLNKYLANSNTDSDSDSESFVNRETDLTLYNSNFENDIISGSSSDELRNLSDSEYDSILPSNNFETNTIR